MAAVLRFIGVLSAWLAAVVVAALATAAPAAPPSLHFPSAPSQAAAALSDDVLNAQERAFIATLPEIRVAVPMPPFSPYEIVDASGEVSGIHPEMLLALGKAFGLRLRPVAMANWPAAMDAARRHEVDLLMTLGVTPERLEFLEFTLGATPSPAALFVRKGVDGDEASLRRGRFALERGFVANDLVRRQYPNATVLAVDDTAQALRAVTEGRAEYYIGSLLATTDLIARKAIGGTEVSRIFSYNTGYFHFAVRRDWAPLAQILNKGIQTLRGTPSPALAAALGALPPGMTLHKPIPLGDAEREVLASRAVWRVGAVRGLAMLNDVDANGQHSGIGADYTAQVAQRLGVAAQVVAFDNVAAMLDALRAGRIDLVPLLTRTAQREREFRYSKPYFEMPYVLVARHDAPIYWGLDSLRGKRLALALDHPLRELLAKDYADIRIVDARNGSDALDKVVDGKADAAVEVRLFANLRINGDNDGVLRALAPVEQVPAQFAFAASKNAQALIPLVDRALADISADERRSILRRWVAIDLQPALPWRRWLPTVLIALLSMLAVTVASLWWARRLSREVDARRRSEELLNDIAATVPGVVFRYVVRADGTIAQHYVSPGAKAFLGLAEIDPRKTLTQMLLDRVRPADRAACVAAEAESWRSGERYKMTAAYRHPDGRDRWLHAEAVQSPATPGGRVWTGYMVDVSTERALQARLAREAESRNLMLASASHELRAPTHTLVLALQSVHGRKLPAEELGALDIARGAARTLSRLLNDVLDAARPTGEAIQLRPRSFDLHELLGEVAAAWRAAARTKNLDFTLTLAPELPRRVVLDPMRLKQILTNLLSNACKYTLAGRVWLQVSPAGPGDLCFVVGDTGIGIAAETQALLFNPYVTLDIDAGIDIPEGRSGLGLAICRQLAGLMGGSIELQSEPGRGTEVTLTLPVPAEAAPLRPPGGGGGVVLVCDDDAVSRLLMTHMLLSCGFSAEACDARAARERWQRGDVWAIVTDLNMPEVNGLQLIREVRAAEAAAGATRRTVIVVCSGSDPPQGGGADRRDETGSYDAFLSKPVDVEILAQTLREVRTAVS